MLINYIDTTNYTETFPGKVKIYFPGNAKIYLISNTLFSNLIVQSIDLKYKPLNMGHLPVWQ